MTHFEYLAIAFTLLFTLAAMRLLGGLPYVIAASRRYGSHVAVCLFQLLGLAVAFWSFWSLNQVTWTFPRFLLALGMPAIIYFNTAALVPENPSEIVSWRDHYYAVRVRYFTGLACFAVVTTASTTVNVGLGWIHPARIGHLMLFCVGLVGAASASARVHRVLAFVLLGFTLLGLVTIFRDPEWLLE